MFETAMLPSGPAEKRVWATCAGFSGQALLVGFALMAPIIWPQAIQHVGTVTKIAPPGAPLGRPPAGSQTVTRRLHPPMPQLVICFFPIPIPRKAPAPSIDLPPDPWETGGISGGLPNGERSVGGIRGGLPADVIGQVRPVAPPVGPPKPIIRNLATTPPAPTPPTRISKVEPATPLHRVEPVYPPLAIAAHVQGIVRLMGVIGTDGRIGELKVLSGHPMLVRAAMDAVQQWIYAPTLLNGEPAEVQAPIEVKFILSR